MPEDASKSTTPSAQENDLDGPAREVQSFIIKGPQILGCADIYNLSFQNPQIRAGLLSAILSSLVYEDRRPVVVRFVILLAPGSDIAEAEVQVWYGLRNTFLVLAGRQMQAVEEANLKSALQLIVARDRQFASALHVISEQGPQTAIIVTESASYRDENIKPYFAPGVPTPLLPEDLWAPHLHALATQAVKLAEARQAYVALDADQTSPSRPAMHELLSSIDGCGVMGSRIEGDLMQILSAKADQWDVWIRDGHLGQVLRDIEELPAAYSDDKACLRIQVLHRAGHAPQALQALREHLASKPKLDETIRVKLARIAQSANASELAIDILSPCIDQLKSLEDLELALATALATESTKIEERVATRLELLFPSNPGIRQRRFRSLAAARDYAGIAALYAEQPDGNVQAEFYQTLASAFSELHVPDYHALIASAGIDAAQAEAYRMACVDDALARDLLTEAFRLTFPIPTTSHYRERGERLLLKLLKGILLRAKKGGELLIPEAELIGAMQSLVEQLAENPDKHFLRFGIVELVQPSVSGSTGMALMVAIVLQLSKRPVRILKRRFRGTPNAHWLEAHMPFIRAALAWLKSEEPIIIGKTILPKAQLTEDPDEVVSAITEYLSNVPIEVGDDPFHFQLYLALASAVTPYSSDPDFDLKLLQLVASRLANSGQYQLARDLTEQAMLNCTATARRRRLGWFVMADVYHRCHNHLEALLALACTLCADDEAEEEQAWLEIMTVIPLLRDCGLNYHARLAIANAHEVRKQLGLSESYAHRLDAIDLQIRYNDLKAIEPNRTELEALLKDVVRNGEAVLQHEDMTEPVAVMLGQLISHAKSVGLAVPEGAEYMFDELCKHLTGSAIVSVAAMSAASPSASTLLAMLKTSEPSRYSGDVGFDMHNVAILAGRSLASDAYIANSADASFALELLADRGVGVPHWDEAAVPAQSPQNISEPAEIASALSKAGLSVLQAGFDATGRLVQVCAVDGVLESAVQNLGDVTARERLVCWAKQYPFDYGIDQKTPNLFYVTTSDLILPSLPGRHPVVVVSDVTLQSFPPNLLYDNEVFAGRVRPMAAAPSLLWLNNAINRGSTGDGRLCAWISTAVGRTESQTLPLMAEWLAPTFEEYGFAVNNDPALPKNVAGASLVVIGAHGGVHPDGRFFQTIADEGQLRVAAEDLADSLRNVDVVILFVCSGGRSDKHPQAVTVLGMAKRILDCGCSAVIASPWPLDPRVAYYWLPVFLQCWSRGSKLIDANFEANQAVDRNSAKDEARGLAMTIMGNPLLLCPDSLANALIG